jgi:hypothetical protein
VAQVRRACPTICTSTSLASTGLLTSPQECDAGASRAILGLQAYVKADTIDRSHHHFLRLDSSKCSGKQDERIPVIGIHVLDNLGCSVS